MVTASTSSQYTILKWQRNMHAAIIKARQASSGSTKTVAASAQRDARSHLRQAVFDPRFPHRLQRVALDDSLQDESDNWSDGGWMSADEDDEDEIDLGGGNPGGGGLSPDDYAASFFSWADGGFTTPSGTTIAYCTVFWSVVAFGGGSWAAGLAYLDSVGAGVSVVIGGAVLNPGALILLVGILAALAAYLAVVC